jgi:hypothetical protein
MKATASWEDDKMEFCRNSIATGGKLNSEQSRYLVRRIEDLEAQLGAFLDSTNRALEFALKRIERISAERIKEIEAHRQTTLKLVALQQEIRR